METVAAEEPVVLFKRAGKDKNKASIRKRPATPPPDNAASDSEYSSEDSSGERSIKRRKKNTGVVTASSAANGKQSTSSLGASKFEASRSTTIDKSDDATRQSNWYDEGEQNQKASGANLEHGDGLYQGAAAYSNFIQKNPNAPQNKAKPGPQKAPTNVRMITVTDYAPDVCKDYKKTGFCGFGDSCKFLHAREDYKQGWQLDKDWEVDAKGKKRDGTTFASAGNRGGDKNKENDLSFDEAEEKLLEKIPFACVICESSYKNPIMTTCGHYFCENCALQRYRKTPNCAICGGGTGGVFNGAKNLKRLLEKKTEREKRKAELEKAKAEDD